MSDPFGAGQRAGSNQPVLEHIRGTRIGQTRVYLVYNTRSLGYVVSTHTNDGSTDRIMFRATREEGDDAYEKLCLELLRELAFKLLTGGTP